MVKLEDLRKLKDQATRAIEKRNYERAAELYVEIAGREPDPDWHHRAGEAFRRAGEPARAIESLTKAADGYGNGGFLLKAIAMCKTIVAIDPQQATMQARLAELYARRDGAGVPSRAPPPVLQPPPAKVVEAAPSPPQPVGERISDRPQPPVLRPPLPSPADVLDQITARRDAPIDALPLRKVLGGRRSETIAVDEVLALAAEAEAAVERPGAYEISLEAEPEIELSIAPSLPKTAPRSIAPSVTAGETDFGDVLTDGPAAAQVPADPPIAADELDFSEVMADQAPPSKPTAPLPKIPLLSSLSEADLGFFIERMTLVQREAGQVIVDQGERGGSMFVIVDGLCSVVANGVRLAQLEPGRFFGEVSVLTDEPRTATVEAAQATTLLEISREVLWELVRRSPEVLRTLLRFVRDRLLERLLSTSALFSMLSPEDGQALASQFVFLELEAGVKPVQQGQRAPGLFFLLSGAAEAVKDGAVLGPLGPGDVFGEMSLLQRAPAAADVLAVRKCWALELPKERFQEIMLTYPQVLAYVSDLGDARKAQNEAAKAPSARVDLL
jgi:CRP-like cAMP-binding protein